MEGVEKSFGATRALSGVSLDVAPGDVHALIGENGAGKSTLMKILAGVLTPDAGRMSLFGSPYRPTGPLDARRRGVAMIHQELTLAPHLDVEANLTLGTETTTFGFVRRAGRRAAIRDVLTRLRLADLPLDTPVGTLSTAVRQLLEIARALLSGARVVIMDEPTSSLGRRDVERLFDIVRELAASGCGIIYISHFMDELREVATRFTVLRDGASVGTGTLDAVDDDALIRLMAGGAPTTGTRAPSVRGTPLLVLDGLEGHPRPTEASLVLHRGEILGITGLVGAGRTELLRAVFGLDPVVSGSVTLAGIGFSADDGPDARWGRGMGFVSEDRKHEGLMLDLPLSVNLTLSRLAPVSRAGFVDGEKLDAASREWIDRLGIRAAGSNVAVGSLSGGNQQKVAIARLLHHDVDVLLLDEPTRGIDVRSKAAVWDLLRSLANAGRGILVVGSHLPEMLAHCDRIAVMNRGRLGEARDASTVTAHDLLTEAVSVAEGRHD